MTRTLLILLPPSETKRDGGSSTLDAFPGGPGLEAIHRRVRADLVDAARGDADAAARALKISPRLAERELARNRALETAPLMPAVLRYTGVLFDALRAEELEPRAREWLDAHVVIHSALYGLVPAGAPIAAYRLSHDSRLSGGTLAVRWREAVTRVLTEHDGPVIDLRSQGYVGLGPLPRGHDRVWAELAERTPDGRIRSLNHFNKKAKGELVRALAERLSGRPEPVSIEDALDAVADRFTAERISPERMRIIPQGENADGAVALSLRRQ